MAPAVSPNPVRDRISLTALHHRLASVGSSVAPVVFLVVRLLIGFECIRSGLKHLVNFEGTAGYFTSLQIPFPAVALVLSALAEMIGGLLLMLGLGTRFACVLLFANFLVAYLTSGRPSLLLLLTLQDAWKFVTYPAFPFLVASAWFFATGPGRLSLDRFVFPEATPPAEASSARA